MQFTGRAKALFGTALVGAGISGTSIVAGSRKDNAIITFATSSRGNSFIFEKGETWNCFVFGILSTKPIPNVSFSALKDSFDSYLEDYQNTKKIKERYTDGFVKSCLSSVPTVSSDESESYEIILNLQQIGGEWRFNEEDLEKVFSGTFVASSVGYDPNMK